MKQKIVMKVYMPCQKCRSKTLEIAPKYCQRFESMAIQGKDENELVVIGEGVDTCSLLCRLRKKVGHAQLISVEEVKPKPDGGGKKQEVEKKKEEIKIVCCYCNQFKMHCNCNPYPPNFYICEPVYEPSSQNCSIM